MENPIKMDDLGVPLFSETSKYGEASRRQELGHFHQGRSMKVTIHHDQLEGIKLPQLRQRPTGKTGQLPVAAPSQKFWRD